MNKEQKPLYRKENRSSSWQNHVDKHKGGEFKHYRNTKEMKNLDCLHLPMKKRGSNALNKYVYSGYDYTPLFQYLLKQVGKRWDDVYSVIIPRLNTTEPIFWMVSLDVNEDSEFFRCGEGSYYSKLYVNENGILQKVNPSLSNVHPQCDCHTHSFNGFVVKKSHIES